MAKKTEEKVEEASHTEKVDVIAPLTQNFDREDLNILRDKINEIIAKR